MRPARRVAAVALALATAPTIAAADELRSTLGEPLAEVSHAVDIAIANGIATYKVRRVFANHGKRADEVALTIDLPYGAAATGLRIRARDRWYDGDLLEAERAATLYHELTGLGAFPVKDPALLQWMWADKLHLQVFPVLPGATTTVEYTLTVPTRYQGGKLFVSYPRVGIDRSAVEGRSRSWRDDGGVSSGGRALALANPVVTVRPAWGDATTRVVVDGVRAAPDTPLVLAVASEPAWAGVVDADPGARYVASQIVVPASTASNATFATAKIKLDIEHTFRGDLHVDLITPANARVAVHAGDGGGDNDLRGTFTVKLPATTRAAGTWRLVVSDHAARDTGSIDAWSIELGAGKSQVSGRADDTPVFIPDAPESATDAGLAAIEIAPPAIDVVAGRLGKVVASPKNSFSRLEIDAAPQLRPLPVKAQVVFAIDASHSEAAPGIDAQLAIARAYVTHVPDAEIEIVAYRRRATRVFGAFVEAKDFDARLAAARKAGKLVPGNGSALDEGARAAAAALAGRKGPLRVVITTDERLRSTFAPKLAELALARLPASAVVHVVPSRIDDDDSVALERDDRNALASIAAAHHGITARMSGLPAKVEKDLVREALALVRPIRIDHFVVSGVELPDPPPALDEGTGVRAMMNDKTAPDRVTIKGSIWGDPYRKEIRVDRKFSKATAAWVFGEDEHQGLSDAEMMKVAMMGRAVSPVTSYLATEPGVRPSPIGIDRVGWGSIGHGAMGSLGRGGGSMRAGRPRPDLRSLLADGIGRCTAIHKPATGWTYELEVETTLDEVVDVIPRSPKSAFGDCLVEAAWAVRLDARFDFERESFELALR